MFPVFGWSQQEGGRGRDIKVDELMVIFCWIRNPSGGTLAERSGIFIADTQLFPSIKHAN